MWIAGVLRRFLVCQLIGLVIAVALAAAIWTIAPRIAVTQTYPNLPQWRVQEIYSLPVTRDAMFRNHRDPIADWSEPVRPFFFFAWGNSFCEWLVHTLPARIVPAPLRLVQLLQGPAQVQVLRSLVLLGVPDLLADKVLSIKDLHRAILANAPAQSATLRAGLMPKQAGSDVASDYPNFDTLPLSKLDRLMTFALSMGYFEEVSYRGSRIYVHNHQSVVLRSDHPNNLNHLLFHFGNEAYLAWHHLFDAVLAPEDAFGTDSSTDVREEKSSLGEDATRGGSYSTLSSQQALLENTAGQDRTIAALRAQLLQHSATTSQPHEQQTAWQRAFDGEELWSFYSKRPALERNFAGAMSQVDVTVNKALVADYDWETFGGQNKSVHADARTARKTDTVVDMGGAEGSFLAAVLNAHPSLPHGVLFDLDGNIAAARKLWQGPDAVHANLTHGADARSVDLVAGDFFNPKSIPQPHGNTKYVLRLILHDWSDRDAARILHSLRTALLPSASSVRVLLIEIDKTSPSTTRSWMDGQMLICCNAQERTLQQWVFLLRVSGWTLVQQTQTRSHFSIFEIEIDPTADATNIAPAGSSTATPAPTATSTTAASAAEVKQEL